MNKDVIDLKESKESFGECLWDGNGRRKCHDYIIIPKIKEVT